MAADVPKRPEDPEVDGCWLSQHTRFVCQSREREPDILLVGDSVLYNLQFTPTYKTYFEPLHCLNFSIHGDETQNVLWRVVHGELDEIHVKIIVLAVGTHNNHSASEIFIGIRAIIDVINQKQPYAHVIVMGLLPCGREPNPRRKKHEEVNRLLSAELTQSLNRRVVYICPDWDSLLNPATGNLSHHDMLDYRVPTEAGYAKFIDPLIEELQSSLQTFLKTNAPSTSPL